MPRHPSHVPDSLGMTRACSGPTAAATVAAAPHAKTNQNTFAWPVFRSSTRAGISTTAQIVSLRKAWLPRPSAKNANRQLSCSISPGSVSPRARKASLVVPQQHGRRSTQAPVTRPTSRRAGAAATARRQIGDPCR